MTTGEAKRNSRKKQSRQFTLTGVMLRHPLPTG
jgi:hypothetical protein